MQKRLKPARDFSVFHSGGTLRRTAGSGKERNGTVKTRKKSGAAYRYLKNMIPLYLMLIIPLLYFLVFRYAPMGGLLVAFKKYNVFQGILDSPWVGLQWFKEALGAREFWVAIKNTLVLNLGELFFCFPFPIVLAILLTDMSNSEKQRKQSCICRISFPPSLSRALCIRFSARQAL